MNEFAKMDIFFVIASIGCVAVIVCAIVITVYIKKLLVKLHEIADDAKKVSEDTRDVAHELKTEVDHAKSVIGGVTAFLSKRKHTRKPKS